MDLRESVHQPMTSSPEHFRRESMGAFAHEVRTPLTSIRMVLELARRQSGEGELVLDRELAEMLAQSVDDLQKLADDLQEVSRLERGKLVVTPGPADLAAAVEAARELLGERIQLAGPTPEPIDGPWDPPRLVRAIAGFGDAANRMGDGSGSVAFDVQVGTRDARLTFESGTENDQEKPIAADAGFAFFRSRQFVLAMGGSVDHARSERHARLVVSLPLDPERGS